MKKIVLLSIVTFFLFNTQSSITAAQLRDMVISEVGWSGTVASTSDEWIELYNNTDNDIDLTGWTLIASDGTPNITLTGIVTKKAYFLLERTGSNTTNVSEDQIYTGVLGDAGESLTLKDNSGNIIDTANSDGGSWPAGTGGSGTPVRASMERVNLTAADTDSNWITNDGVVRNGADSGDNPINGTPKAQNSQGFNPTPTPLPPPTNTPIPVKAPTPTPTKSSGQTATTPTPTPTPTQAAAKTPTKNPTPKEKASVLSENITTEPTPSPTESQTPSPTPQTLTVGFFQQNLSVILIIAGGVLLLAAGILFYHWHKQEMFDETENSNN